MMTNARIYFEGTFYIYCKLFRQYKYILVTSMFNFFATKLIKHKAHLD